jgi:Dyp-type peroxidase family
MLLDRIEATILSEIDLGRDEAIDPAEPAYRHVLERLQGNILKGHGREHMDLLLLRFTVPAEEARAWVRGYAQNWMTSAWEQLKENRDTGVFGALYLTANGYEALGFARREIEKRFGHQNQIVRFTEGMEKAGQELNDIPVSGWEEKYRSSRTLHAMALLASNSRDLLTWAGDRLKRSFAGVGTVFHQETGAVLRNAAEERIEPFGFVDGRSQPVFFKEQLKNEQGRRGVGAWNPVAPLGLVLVPDPLMERADCLGSYLVFRKLRQDVDGFRQRVAELAAELTDGNEKFAEALVVGRFKNGTPLAVYEEEKTGPEHDDNGFDYSADYLGARCPLHAHARRTNPRTHDARLRHRIVRRGMPYKTDSGEQGMLFLCFQSKIHEQFAYIQSRWANSSNFPWPGAGIDPLIGQSGFQQTAHQQWQTTWGAKPDEYFNFSGLVTLKGGEFFFAPSLPFLLGL